jgi:hypothetical protein
MSRKCLARLAVGSCLALALVAAPAWSMAIRQATLPERVAMANVIVVGKVVEIEKKNVQAKAFSGAQEKTEYRVAVVEIKDAILGAKGLTHVRVAFLPEPKEPAVRPGGPVLLRKRAPLVQLTKDTEACFFLTPHFEESFHVIPNLTPPIESKAENFKKDLAEARRIAKLLENPKAGLKSKNAADRELTAGLLLVRYRTPLQGETKQEPIDAEESKQILETLAGADFGEVVAPTRFTAEQAFFRLGLTDKDGWKPAQFKDFQIEFPPVAKKWLKENAEKYRIQRFVAEKKEK